MDEKNVTLTEFEGRTEICNERYGRDKERLDGIERNLQELSRMITQMAEMQAHTIKSTDDQEERLRVLEKRGGKWLDKIVEVALGILIGYIITKSFGI